MMASSRFGPTKTSKSYTNLNSTPAISAGKYALAKAFATLGV